MSFYARDRGSHAGRGGPGRVVPRPGRRAARRVSGRPSRPAGFGARAAAGPAPVDARLANLAGRHLVMAIIVVGGFLDGFAQELSAEGTVQAFLLAWQRHDYRAAAAYTTGPAPAVSGALAGAFTQLDATAMFLSMGRVDQSGDTAEAHFFASVNLGEGGHQWTYPGQFALRRTGSGWKVQWAPSVINPQLGPGARLAVITQVPARGQVLDARDRRWRCPRRCMRSESGPGPWPTRPPRPRTSPS